MPFPRAKSVFTRSTTPLAFCAALEGGMRGAGGGCAWSVDRRGGEGGVRTRARGGSGLRLENHDSLLDARDGSFRGLGL
jgi:hypothetical protein